MVSISSLWLPIIVSAVIVFIASSVIHMATSWHKGDFKVLPDEEATLSALRGFSIPPGDYFAPRAGSMKDMGSPEFKAKMEQGPVIIMTVRPNGQANMGKLLGTWFVYLVVVSFFCAYIASHALPVGAHYLKVFQIVGMSAFLAYVVALWQSSIWWSKSWLTTFKSTVDGLIFGLLTAGVFGWLWPR